MAAGTARMFGDRSDPRAPVTIVPELQSLDPEGRIRKCC